MSIRSATLYVEYCVMRSAFALQASASGMVNAGASTSSGITADMLEEPQRLDSALHPLIEARRAVLQDLANNPSQASTAAIAIPSSSGMEHDLTPPSRADSALDTLTAARATVRTISPWGFNDSPRAFSDYPRGFHEGPSSSHWPDQASSSSMAVSAEASGQWAPAGYGGLPSEISSATSYGPPMIDNPSQTLEEARRLVASGQLGEPSSSSSFSHAGPSSSGLARSNSRTLEEARRLVMGSQTAGPESSRGAKFEGAGQGGQGLHGELGFCLQRDSAQHPLVEARRTVLEDLAKHPSKACEHAATSSGNDAGIMRQHSLQRDSPLEPIVLARQAMQEASQHAIDSNTHPFVS